MAASAGMDFNIFIDCLLLVFCLLKKPGVAGAAGLL
jgi:hypothetical protein